MSKYSKAKAVKVLGIDLAKDVFHLHGVDESGRMVLRKILNWLRYLFARFLRSLLISELKAWLDASHPVGSGSVKNDLFRGDYFGREHDLIEFRYHHAWPKFSEITAIAARRSGRMLTCQLGKISTGLNLCLQLQTAGFSTDQNMAGTCNRHESHLVCF